MPCTAGAFSGVPDRRLGRGGRSDDRPNRIESWDNPLISKEIWNQRTAGHGDASRNPVDGDIRIQDLDRPLPCFRNIVYL